MRVLKTRMDGPLLLEPAIHGDARGFFLESYRAELWAQHGISETFVQDNHSRSARGVMRGMHVSIGEGQAKLVRCARGAILDVIVDIRSGSPTYGEWESFDLNDAEAQQLYIPIGFAHGFCVTSDVADVTYKCSTYYDPEVERGFHLQDPDIGIDWPTDLEPIISPRDHDAPMLHQIKHELPF